MKKKITFQLKKKIRDQDRGKKIKHRHNYGNEQV